MLEITLGLLLYSIINIFQTAAGILARQQGRSFWLWFGIGLILPGISLGILIFLWDMDDKQKLAGLAETH
jgi:energy-coupling factor transporter transmembrane protein EcfT